MIKSVEGFINQVGEATILFFRTLIVIFTHPPKLKHIFKHMEEIGANAVLLIMITGFFMGGVIVIEIYPTFHKFNAEFLMGAVVSISLSRELSPVLVALLVTARSGSAMSANIGTMRITEQIDALEVLAVDPIRYLIAPRLIAAFLVVPSLTILSIASGIVGGYIISTEFFNVNPFIYWEKMKDLTEFYDILGGVMKSVVFGIALTTVACYFGYTATGGAEGVGKATTKGVVVASVLILILDYFLTPIIF